MEVCADQQDHVHNLSQYLQFYCDVPEADIVHAKMIDLSDEGMTLILDGNQSPDNQEEHFVPFEPALKDLEGIRPRVIEMAKAAEAGLNKN
ncbi:protein of unknown function [Taphrina deformans PYCC 5710]|uniref:DUF2470 domain-containing protein n=1 Tax=Taphrina deformans (strain PYCC 5710 / ATCC 11124 / CBS 356.35 / IMI 108563 / JCM 9778 / NBRC 8474) TaxID=1097556 RepID=R4XFW3_TAPDE|nr:protein of unknown function [Taphrina deformans PYCC 5710]|eukprot:CCG84766.1 protein of unknown function [Taphrina deformans PYCC 5710]